MIARGESIGAVRVTDARARRARTALALALSLGGLWLAGCSSGDDGVSPGPPTTYVEAEPNDFNAQSLGALDSTDITVGGAASSDADVDLFSITLSEPMDLFVQLDWTGGQDLEFAVSDDQGVFVTFVDTGARPEACTLPVLGASTRLIRVGSRSSSPANYVLTIGPR